MKSSCISHPANEPLVVIRQWQIEFCEGNTAAAALISFFEYWHNVKMEMSKQNKKLIKVASDNGVEIDVDISLYQWHTSEDLAAGIMDVVNSKATLKKSLDILVEKGAISIHHNPNPRFKFDRTRYFLFHPEVCTQFLAHRRKEMLPREEEMLPPGEDFDPAITENTDETTKENLGKPNGLPRPTPAEQPLVKHPKPVKPDKPTEQLPQPKKELFAYFADYTHLTPPANSQDIGFWYKNIGEILVISKQDLPTARRLIKQSVDKLRADDLTISTPGSLVKTIRALAANGGGGKVRMTAV